MPECVLARLGLARLRSRSSALGCVRAIGCRLPFVGHFSLNACPGFQLASRYFAELSLNNVFACPLNALPPACEFRRNPARDSDLMSATVPI